MNFLDHYNNELRQLRESGTRFAKMHPQVAAELGLHADAVADPFVERLLEGVAFLSARVQNRLDRECAEFAQQALSRLCPIYMSATPAITTFAFHPDFGSPETFRGKTMPRGTLIRASIAGRAQPVTFSTAREVTLLPLRLASAQCTRSVTNVSAPLGRRLASAPAVLRLRFELENTTTLSDLLRQSEGKPLQLSLAGDLPSAFALHQAMLVDTSAWFGVVQTSKGEEVLNMPMSALSLSGVGEEEALLPPDMGAMPWLRVLREYFAQPTRLLGVQLNAIAPIAAAAPGSRSFDLVFALKRAPQHLIDNVSAGQFRLFSTPVINLYSRRLDPVPYDPNQTGQWLPVDRMRPNIHHLWALTEVNSSRRDGQTQLLLPVLDTGGYSGSHSDGLRYGLRREIVADGSRQDHLDPMASYDTILVSVPEVPEQLEEISTLLCTGLVADRGWRPEALLGAGLQLAEPQGVQKVECLWMPSSPRGMPALAKCWDGASWLGQNPLAVRGTGREEVTSRIQGMLQLAADTGDALDRQRLESLRSINLNPAFIRGSPGTPMAWVHATRVDIDIADSYHSDRGGWLFGRVLAQALAEAVTLNDGVEINLRLDGELISTHSNTLHENGVLS